MIMLALTCVLESSQPVLSNEDLYRIRHIHDHAGDAFQTATLDITYYASKGRDGMREAIYDLCAAAKRAVEGHFNILISVRPCCQCSAIGDSCIIGNLSGSPVFDSGRFTD